MVSCIDAIKYVFYWYVHVVSESTGQRCCIDGWSLGNVEECSFIHLGINI